MNKKELVESHYFMSAVYTTEVPEYLDSLRKVSKEYLTQSKKQVTMNKIYPVMMSPNFVQDERVKPFVQLIEQTSLGIMINQGYDMSSFDVLCHEVWAQEHHQFSGQEEHIHPNCQISGFYFLDVPKDSSRVVFHDGNQAKKMIALPESNMNNATYASTMINYEPKPGMMMFTNSWLSHSFLKNSSKKPFTFIHFNVTLMYKQGSLEHTGSAEVI